MKRVVDVGGVRAAIALRRWRETAVRNKTPLIFPACRRGTKEVSSSTVSTNLRSALRKLGMNIRVTSHSARKGSALEALLAGVPLIAIQAFGGWRDLATLERYVGDAVRRNIAVGQVLNVRTCGNMWNGQLQTHL